MFIKQQTLPVIDDQIEICCIYCCREYGTYRAPLSKQSNGTIRYGLFCKVHAREQNQGWNYFHDMNADEIDRFRYKNLYGHSAREKKETCEGVHYLGQQYESTCDQKVNNKVHSVKDSQSKIYLPLNVQEALSEMNFKKMPELHILKNKFRILVKQHHPDMHRESSKQTEHAERLKLVNSAYHVIKKYIFENQS